MAEKTRLILEGVDRTRQAFSSAQRSLGTLESTARRAQAAFAALIGAGAIGGTVRTIAEAGLEMERFDRTFKAATGSAEAGRREFEFVSDLAEELGLQLDSTAGAYAKLTAASNGTKLAGEQTREIFKGVSSAAVVLGLSADQTAGALTAIEQIISKGRVSAEELRGQLGERLPGAFQIAARSIGRTTAELDELLKKGQLAADDFLPSFAAELQRTYGDDIPDAVDSAAASFNRFSTSIFKLKASIAESGLLDLLADVAEGIAEIVTPDEVDKSAALFDVFKQEKETLKDLNSQLEQMLALNALTAAEADNFRLRIVEQEAAVNSARDAWSQYNSALQEVHRETLRAQQEGGDAGPTTILDGVDENEMARFLRQFQTAEQEVAQLQEQLQKFAGALPPEEVKRISDEINSILIEGIEEIDLNSIKKLRRISKRTADEMTEISKQAARNMQSNFADFLFDPFDEGLDGMLKGFLDVVRRMLAEQASASILNAIGVGGAGGGIFGGISSLFGFADGGQFTVAGGGGVDSKLVQFMATPGERVTVEKPGQNLRSGNVTNNYYFEAGADIATIEARIIPRIEQGKVETMAEIAQARIEGQFP